MMKRFAILLAAVLVGMIALSPQPAFRQTETSVTAGASGIFPSGTSFNGVPLNGLRFGFGLTISSTGSAAGNFQATLLGTSLLGQTQEIIVEGKASSGSVPAAGTATFSGTASVNMGDGTAPLTGVPFTATATAGGAGQGSLLLSLGTTNLPAASVNKGSITVK
jgi:hypothetical protein